VASAALPRDDADFPDTEADGMRVVGRSGWDWNPGGVQLVDGPTYVAYGEHPQCWHKDANSASNQGAWHADGPYQGAHQRQTDGQQHE